MAINLPGNNLPAGDLARVVSQEPDEEWPTIIEVVAYYGNDRRGKAKRVSISADQFFGRKGYNAPMTADQFFFIVDRLRREK